MENCDSNSSSYCGSSNHGGTFGDGDDGGGRGGGSNDGGSGVRYSSGSNDIRCGRGGGVGVGVVVMAHDGVDESEGESKRGKMAIILRFVDKYGFIKEHFFDIVHGYDVASNMSGEWTGLQAVFCAECPFAYYVHCFVHRLQLALVGASKQTADIVEKLAIDDEFETGKGKNQIGTLKRAGDTRWGSHLGSIFDSQLQELNNWFKGDVIELLVLSSALDLWDGYRSFKIEDICNLANKFYPMDFSVQEKLHLKYQLENYKLDISILPEFQKLSTISKLCQMLAKTKILKLVKSKLCNRMEDGFLASYLITYIEKDIARRFVVDSIIHAFDIMKER
ncbi:uncharacterized protein LOC114286451 [Camellia sinensis]|uniref:uncharacterized protein LOC114286451 n=1 Tax=Camellia sinensis TaxID=4442 RepID=UPI0010364149|nr:uncharacterized protein LOC114286451 [Camellia sinensis]